MIARAIAAPSAVIQMRSGSSLTSAATVSAMAPSRSPVYVISGAGAGVQVDPGLGDQRRPRMQNAGISGTSVAELERHSTNSAAVASSMHHRLDADRGAAVAALAAQGEPAQHRHQIERAAAGARTSRSGSAAATTEPPCGTRSTTTVRNEPINNPITAHEQQRPVSCPSRQHARPAGVGPSGR